MDTGIDVKKRLNELAEKAYRENRYVFTDFLNISQMSEYYGILKKTGESEKEYSDINESNSFEKFVGGLNLSSEGVIGQVDCRAFGGTQGCERCVVRFGSLEMFGYEEPYPITLLRIYPAMAKYAEQLTHRDYLGSLIGLGLEREKIGDIVIPRGADGARSGDNSEKSGSSEAKKSAKKIKGAVYVFVIESIADYIIENLGYVKHTNVRVERCDEVPEEVVPHLEEMSVIVSSNRIDAIVAKLYNLSREQSLKLFVEGKVFLNGITMTSNARPLKAGDTISVRGYGKFIFDGEGGSTRKEKLYVNVKKYV